MKALKHILALSLGLMVSNSLLAADNPADKPNSAQEKAKTSLTQKSTTLQQQSKDKLSAAKTSTEKAANVSKEKLEKTKKTLTDKGDKAKDSARKQVSELQQKGESAKKTVSAKAATKVNINTADAQTLQSLNGIGEAKAKAIIEYRKKAGKIKNAQDLSAIPGIGSATIEKISPYLSY
ncbi:ComEA family DNA-binding protein [Mesocricetibacter intestinalis]|uniref:ComEA family DNA-binding protein n=1 Tax=Mesocricetibacter intestinalis TaxID=1521930 RepID=UPI00105E5C97|nr:helix-hairpin-helix domain-containing protein [Mesocricetibacter intestinalis]